MKYCTHCLKREDDCCNHNFVDLPENCVCDPGTWGGPIDPVCDSYAGIGDGYCRICAHDKECHRRKIECTNMESETKITNG